MAKALVRKYGRCATQQTNARAIGPESLPCLEEISEILNILFSIALSADDDFLTRIMACHALCACKSPLGPQLSESADKQCGLSLRYISCYMVRYHLANDALLSLVGPEIGNPRLQRVLLDLLQRTEVENGWPWSFVSQRLSKEWGVRLP